MSKIKVFCIGLWFIMQRVVVPINSVRASSSCDIRDCAKGDALIITFVSAGFLVLEKITEKIYKYCMSRYTNQNSEAEQTDGLENNNDTIIRHTETAEEV